MPPDTLNHGIASPLVTGASPEHLQQIAVARKLGAKVRRAQGVAVFSGWATAVFAFITLILSIFSVYGLLLGMGMAVVSVFEFRGANEIKRLDRTAPRRLAINQVVFGLMLFAYAGISIYISLHTPSEIEAQIGNDPQLRQMLGDIPTMYKTITLLVYGSVMLAAILGPGLTAIYYYTRTKYIDAYVTQTPQWILDLQRAGMSI